MFLHLGQTNCLQTYRLGTAGPWSSSVETDMRILADRRQSMRQPCGWAAKAANSTLGSMNRSMARRSSEVIRLFCSTFVGQHVQYCTRFLAPQDKGTPSPRRSSRRQSQALHNGACWRRRDHSHRSKRERSMLERSKNFSAEKTGKHWNMLPRETLLSAALEGFEPGSSPQQPAPTPKLIVP